MRMLESGRHRVALHEIRDGGGPTLLWLHALGGSARDAARAGSHWPGRVLALDFPDHGASPRPLGGVYTCELFAADADAALEAAGDACLAGEGVGAYVALLLAGTRADRVPAALLLPGRGLDGGGPEPDFTVDHATHDAHVAEVLARNDARDEHELDPMLYLVERDLRPPDYALQFAEAARRLLLGEDGGLRPPWWRACREAPDSESAPADLPAALARLLAHGLR